MPVPVHFEDHSVPAVVMTATAAALRLQKPSAL